MEPIDIFVSLNEQKSHRPQVTVLLQVRCSLLAVIHKHLSHDFMATA